MASSTPPPHSTMTTAKPYQNHHNHHHRNSSQHWTPLRVSLNNHQPSHASAHKPPPPSAAAVAATGDTSAFPCLSTSDFSGRRSTRFVSKLHFGRPRSTSSSRHSSAAEEAIRCAIGGGGRLECMDGILLSFQSKLCSSDDYTFLLRELGNRGEWYKAMRYFQFAISREKRRNELGKLTTSMISTLGRLSKVDLTKKVFDDAVNMGYGNTVYAYSALFSAYAKSGHFDEAIGVFKSMKDSGLMPNLATYSALIDACGKGGGDFKRASEILVEMLQNGGAT